MGRHLLPLLLLVFTPQLVFAQRDAPLIECYLPSIRVSHAEGNKLSLELILKKETGPVEHTEHQMLLLVYLLDDEKSVLETTSNPELLDKTKGGDEKLFLDVLLEKGLVTIVDSNVATRQGFAGQDNLGKYADGSKAGRSVEDFLKLNAFAFSFTPTYEDLYKKVSKLKHFRSEDPADNGVRICKQRFKILAYVPVNDCKYASEVHEEIRNKNDFGLGEYGRGKTPILYCRPLPYEFKIRRDGAGGTTIYIR